jgi:hypothetical protein
MYKFGKSATRKALVLQLGNAKKMFKMEFISNSPFTEVRPPFSRASVPVVSAEGSPSTCSGSTA